MNDPDFSHLGSDDIYARYFNVLETVFSRMLACYPAELKDNFEGSAVQAFLQRLHSTVELLRIKYAYRAVHDPALLVDITDSGFPSAQGIHDTVTDLLTREQKLAMLPSKNVLTSALLDGILQRQDEPEEIRWQLASREYLERLTQDRLFLPFTPGNVMRLKEAKDQRVYAFSWGCYDFRTSRPYIHIMTATQDVSQQPLEEGGTAWQRFLEVLKSDGSRVADIAILAMQIDEAIDWLHPKILKRLCIGPLYIPLVFQQGPIEGESEEQKAVRGLLERYAKSENDFLLFATNEIVFSESQRVTSRLLRKEVREVFAITSVDPECYKRNASVVEQNVLLPHWVLQNVDDEFRKAFPLWERHRKITYDEKGVIEIHG